MIHSARALFITGRNTRRALFDFMSIHFCSAICAALVAGFGNSQRASRDKNHNWHSYFTVGFLLARSYPLRFFILFYPPGWNHRGEPREPFLATGTTCD